MISITAKKKYGDRVVLDVSDLAFERGKCYALIGANGSGKTTLLKALDGQLKVEGRVDVGECIVRYMPQTSYPFSMSVKRNIWLPCPIGDRERYTARMETLVEALDLKPLLRKNAAKLSGGETQRMALARTLIADSDIILLDEPTAAMDVEQAQSVLRLLRSELATGRVTVIFATHSFRQAELLADEVIFLSKGKVVERNTPSKLLHEPQSSEARAFISMNI